MMAIYLIDENRLHAPFHISNGSKIWSGQFDGSKSIWREAKSILNTLKKANKNRNEMGGSAEPPIR